MLNLKFNLAASFQNTVNKILFKKTKTAIEMFKARTKKNNVELVVAGGVAANKSSRPGSRDLSSWPTNLERYCGWTSSPLLMSTHRMPMGALPVVL